MADTLFDTIGGRLKINAAVEAFYRRVLADESRNLRKKIIRHAQTNKLKHRNRKKA